MALKIIGWIPLLQCLVSFPFDSHRVALKKFVTLWLLASLPILVAAFWSPASGDANWFVLSKFRESISVSEQFVYVASFLTPVLYVWYEKIQAGKRDVKGLFSGYGLVSLLAAIVMLITAAAFGSIKNNEESFKSTVAYTVLSEHSMVVYLFALYCWYLSLIDGLPGGDFVAESRRSEQVVTSGLSERLKNRGN